MLRTLNTLDSPQMVAIHSQALAGDFLPSLGKRFLTSFYQGIIQKPGVFSFGFYDDKKLVGYVIGVREMSQLFRQALRSKAVYLAVYLILAIINKPSLIKKVLETFLYPQKEIGPKAELVVIVVLDKFQGQGIGKQLVNRLEKAFLDDGIYKYKLTVHADKKAVSFYEHLIFSRIGSFKLYDKIWYLYEKEIVKNKH